MPTWIVTPPSAEPLSLQEAKDHLRLDTAADDAYVNTLITAARQWLEEICWRGILTQTLELVLERFRGEDAYGNPFELSNRYNPIPRAGTWYTWPYYAEPKYIELPGGNLQSLTSVTYIDPSGTSQTLDPSVYLVDNVNKPGRLRLAPMQFWPPTQERRWDAVRIRYVVGFGDTETAVPVPLLQVMKLLISQMYEHRTPEVAGMLSAVQFSLKALYDPYRLVRVG